MILTINVKDGWVFVYVDKRLLWTGPMERWSFALANALVVNTRVVVV